MSVETPGLEALCGVRPMWTRLARADALFTCEGRWLLHAGPPYAHARVPPAPVLSSAVLACLYEGWAASEADAESMIARGEVRLESAQAHRCVTPLAALVSPSTTVIVVEDQHGAVAPAYAPLGTTGGPDLRFGTRDTGILARLRLRDTGQAQTLAAALSEPIDLFAIALDAVKGGDDLHNRTAAATRCLVQTVSTRLEGSTVPREHAARLIAALDSTPLFFLTFWMAAAKLILSAAESRAPASLVTCMAGNGEVFGVVLAGAPGRWVTMPTTAPQGPRMPGVPDEAQALGAIGDSAVIDALGFGGQALQFAPEPEAALRDYLPRNFREIPSAVLTARHPAFDDIDLRVGLDAARIVASGIAPLVTLGMVERTGARGLLGRGVFRPPVALFRRALDGLAAKK